MLNSLLLDLLARAHHTLPQAEDARGRKESAQFAICTDPADPLNLRRVRTTTADKAGLTTHDHAMRSLPCPYWDPPMPTPGQSLVAEAFDGNPHDQTYLGVLCNDTNPPFPKGDPYRDDWREIPGDSVLNVGGDATHTTTDNHAITSTQGNITITASDGAITLSNGAGASITLNADGSITIETTGAIELLSSDPVTINGNEVAVVGALDSANQPLVNSGQ